MFDKLKKSDFSYVFNYFCEPTTTEKEVHIVKKEKGDSKMNPVLVFNFHSIVYEQLYTDKKTN